MGRGSLRPVAAVANAGGYLPRRGQVGFVAVRSFAWWVWVVLRLVNKSNLILFIGVPVFGVFFYGYFCRGWCYCYFVADTGSGLGGVCIGSLLVIAGGFFQSSGGKDDDFFWALLGN